MKLNKALTIIREIAQVLPDDDPDKLEMLDMEGDYSDFMEWALRKRNESLAMKEANKDLFQMYKLRAARFDKKADYFKDICAALLESANERSFKGVAGTVSYRSVPPKVIIIRDELIPDAYVQIKRVPDKVKIKTALSNDELVAGALLSNGGETLSIRVK